MINTYELFNYQTTLNYQVIKVIKPRSIQVDNTQINASIVQYQTNEIIYKNNK